MKQKRGFPVVSRHTRNLPTEVGQELIYYDYLKKLKRNVFGECLKAGVEGVVLNSVTYSSCYVTEWLSRSVCGRLTQTIEPLWRVVHLLDGSSSWCASSSSYSSYSSSPASFSEDVVRRIQVGLRQFIAGSPRQDMLCLPTSVRPSVCRPSCGHISKTKHDRHIVTMVIIIIINFINNKEQPVVYSNKKNKSNKNGKVHWINAMECC